MISRKGGGGVQDTCAVELRTEIPEPPQSGAGVRVVEIVAGQINMHLAWATKAAGRTEKLGRRREEGWVGI